MNITTKLHLRDVCDFIVDCLHSTAEDEGEGYPLVRTPNIGRGLLHLANVHRVSEAVYEERTRRGTPEPGDLVLAREAPAGNVAIVRDGEKVCLGQRTVHLRPDRGKVDPDFLCYFLLSRDQQAKLLAGETGATAKHVNMRDIRNLDVSALPDLGAQRLQGAMIRGYDDLIVLNQRRITLLEDSARHLYREWFVRLRFPGAEHVKISGGVPDGWEDRTLGGCARFLSGGTPSKARGEFWEGDLPWVSSGEMTQLRLHDTELHVSPEGAEAGSRVVPPSTILAVVRGMSLAKEFRIAMTATTMAFNQDLKALVCNDGVDPLYLFFAMVDQRDYIRDLATEAAHGTKKLEMSALERVRILLPSPELQSLFREYVAPLMAQWDNLTRQNQKLRTARDLLLPRLMSGQIAV